MIFREVDVKCSTEVEQNGCLNIITVWKTSGFHRFTIGSPKVVGGFWILDEEVKIGFPFSDSPILAPSIVDTHKRGIDLHSKIGFRPKGRRVEQYCYDRVILV